jgi:PTH1 family peptidyl-tRNA hydrolase
MVSVVSIEAAIPEVESEEEEELKPAGFIYCIVGLGNPGLRYENTPHNVGFRVIDELARRHGIQLKVREGAAITGSGHFGDREVLLVKPQTFMNDTGRAVTMLMRARRLGRKDLIIVHDELDLLWTGLKIRKKGSAAGHNGVRSVIAAVGTMMFTRVRVGIHPDHDLDDPAVYVLAPWERAMRDEVDEVAGYAADAVESIVAEGANKAMTKFNRRARGTREEEE